MQRSSYANLAAIVLLVEGIAVMLGWLARVPLWTPLTGHGPAMVFNTALCLAMAGVALLLPRLGIEHAFRIRMLLAFAIALVALLGLAENSFPLAANVDWQALHDWHRDGNPHPGRMAPNTAVALLAASATLLLSGTELGAGLLLYALPAAIITIGAIGIMAYWLVIDLAYSWYGFPRMALPTAFGIIVLGAGLVFDRYHHAADASDDRLEGETRVYTFLGVATTILIAIVFVAQGSINGLLDRVRMVEHSNQVRNKFEALTALYNRAHSEWRDYLVTGMAVALTDFQTTTRELPARLDALQALTAESPGQQAQLDALRGIVAEDLDYLNAGIRLKQQGRLENHDEIALQIAGVRFNQVRLDNVTQTFRQHEHEVLQERQEESRQSSGSVTLVIAGGGTLGFAMLIYAFWILKRQQDERNRLEGSLQASNTELAELYNKAPCGYHTLDAKGGFLRINDTELAWLGYRRDEVIGKLRYSDLHTPESVDKLLSNVEEFRSNGAIKNLEYEYVRKDGSRLPVLLNAIGVFDEAGNLLMTHSTVYDITQRKQLEQELHRNNIFLDSIIDNIPAMILVKEAKTLSYVRVNKAAEKFIGQSEKDVIGKNAAELNPENAERSLANDRAVLATGRLIEIPEQEIHLPHLGRRFIHTTKIPLLPGADGQPQYLLSIGDDITERKQAEEQIRALNTSLERRAAQLELTNKELESFSYSISHDLRAPVRAIDGYAQMVEEDYGDRLDAEGRRYLVQVREHSRRMGALIDDLLRFSRLGRQALNKCDIDMEALVREVIAEVMRSHEGTSPGIEVGALPRAHADPTLLRQVWVNLLDNAVKYSGKVAQPRIAIAGANGSNGEAEYHVRDNGAGFDMAYYDKLFGVFHRLHRADEFPGTGVGLAIVQRAVTRHGGHVWAEGKVGGGAAFHFTLPSGDSDE